MKPCKNCGSYGANIGCDVCGAGLQRIKRMDASDIIIAIRRIIVRGGSTLDILRFLDDATAGDGHPGWQEQTALDDFLDERLEESQRITPDDSDLNEPLGQACKIDDPECESCQ